VSERKGFCALTAVTTEGGTYYGVTGISYGLYQELVKMQALLVVARKNFAQLQAFECADSTTSWYEVIPWRRGAKTEERLEQEDDIDRRVEEGTSVPVDEEWLDEVGAVERCELIHTRADKLMVLVDSIYFMFYEKYSGESIHTQALSMADIEKHFHGD
jgi:hypothetical protein